MCEYKDPVVIAAMNLAVAAHSGQFRKYTGLPYITHPMSVAGILMTYYRDVDHSMIAASILHDVIEDCGITENLITAMTNEDVCRLVVEVTDVSKPSDGNRAARKKIDLEHIAKGSHRSKAIKLADIIDNTVSIRTYDPKFAVVYLEEKKQMLEVLTGVNKPLFDRAYELVYAA